MSRSNETPRPSLSREERLAAALRENLKRRKAQARDREAAEGEPEADAADTKPA
jgi:hypothetical protein